MITENRKPHFIGELILRRSRVLDVRLQPNDDKVNWLFLNTGKRKFSFVYKIENSLKANYGTPFKADLIFTMIEVAKAIVKLNHSYEVLRGEEVVGTIKLICTYD